MRPFLIALQFLTRIKVVRQEVWSMEDFGASVKTFPIVGAVLGCMYAAVAYVFCIFLPNAGMTVPEHVAKIMLLALPLLLTGGIHSDGFMDTMDGVLSGRERDRMLEIMKDSRVGSMGVTAFILYLFFQSAVLYDIPSERLPAAVFVMPIVGRLMMTVSVISFPYARPEGMGKAFANYASKKSLTIAFAYVAMIFAIAAAVLTTLGCSWVHGFLMYAVAALLVGAVVTRQLGVWLTNLLGGLTGDTYGAITLLSELAVLVVFLV